MSSAPTTAGAGGEWSIRLARNPDCPDLPHIERSAAQLFTEFGMADVADGDISGADAWEPHCANETVWVAVDKADHPIGFLASGVQGSVLFIYELAVAREWQRRGVGRALLACADDYALRHHLAGVGLTTFHDVPWNRPFYNRQGYTVLEDADIPPSMHPVMEAEHRRWPTPERRRCAMLKSPANG